MHPTGRQMREGCGIEQPSFGAPEDRKKRWCAGCGKAHGAIHLTYHPLRLSTAPHFSHFSHVPIRPPTARPPNARRIDLF